jgi:hypothetical protein
MVASLVVLVGPHTAMGTPPVLSYAPSSGLLTLLPQCRCCQSVRSRLPGGDLCGSLGYRASGVEVPLGLHAAPLSSVVRASLALSFPFLLSPFLYVHRREEIRI